MLVWNEMLSITWMISPMRLDERLISSMVVTTAPMASLPSRATCVAWPASTPASRAELALCATVLVSCSIEAAVSSRLLACDSVRAERSWLPLAISPDATCTPSTSWRTSVTTACRLTLSWFSARARSPSSPDSCPWKRAERSPAAIWLAKFTASSTGRTIRRRMKAEAMSASAAVAPNAA